MKKIICIISAVTLIFLFPLTVCAADGNEAEELYRDQLSASGAGSLHEQLPEETKKLLSDMDVSLGSIDELSSFNGGKIVETITSVIAEKGRTPIPTAFVILGVMLLCAFTNGFEIKAGKGVQGNIVSAAGTLGVCGAVIAPVTDLIVRSGEVIQGASGFMMLYAPVMSGLMISSAHEIQGSSYYTLLMGACEVIGMLSSKILFPVIKIFLALSITSSVSPSLNLSGITESLSKCMKWVMNFSLGIFVTILTAQNLVTSSLDDVSTRALRFAMNSFVPVVGGVLGEALGTFSGSLSLLKSGTGVFVIIASGCMFLPLLTECLIWRICFFLLGEAADILGIAPVRSVMKAIGAVLSLITAVMLTILVIFIISTVIVLIVGK